MACPYFIPGERCESELWTHRSRLPLGDGYSGHCCAPGHETAAIGEEQLKDCNLGYARCERLPADRKADAVRFLVAKDENDRLEIQFATELAHHPASSGLLKYDATSGRFIATEPTSDASVEKLGLAFVGSYLRRIPRQQAAKR